MSITVNTVSQITTNETLTLGPGDAITLQHTGMNTTASGLTTGSTPAATAISAFALTMAGGAGTIDLTNCPATTSPTQTNATPSGAVVNGTGLHVQQCKLQAPKTNANPITVTPAASNGYKGSGGGFIFQTGGEVVLNPGDEILWTNTSGTSAPAIGSGAKGLTLAGTGADVLNCTFILG